MIGDRIKKLIEESRYSVPQVAERLNMTNQNLYKILKKESVDSNLLFDLSKLFGVPISYFFEDENGSSAINLGEKNIALAGSGNNFFKENAQDVNTISKITELEQKVQHLTELIKQKDIIIAEKERLINTLLKEG